MSLCTTTVVEHDSGHLLLVSHVCAATATTPTKGGPSVHVADKHLWWCPATRDKTLIMLTHGQGLLLLQLSKLPELRLHGAWRIREHSDPQHDEVLI